MGTKELKPALSRRRRHHDAEFKAKIIDASLQPGISIAAVALANEINPNLLRRWVKEHRQRCLSAPVPDSGAEDSEPLSLIEIAVPVPSDHAGASEIRLDVRRGATSIQIVWPVAHSQALGSLLKELLR